MTDIELLKIEIRSLLDEMNQYRTHVDDCSRIQHRFLLGFYNVDLMINFFYEIDKLSKWKLIHAKKTIDLAHNHFESIIAQDSHSNVIDLVNLYILYCDTRKKLLKLFDLLLLT